MSVALQERESTTASMPHIGDLPAMHPGHLRVPQAVVVHGGARDAYQLARALSEAGLLDTLVTDFFWSEDNVAAKFIHRWLPSAVVRKLCLRSAPELSAKRVRTCIRACLGMILLDHAVFVPFALRRWLVRKSDSLLGTTAGRLAKRHNTFLVSYSYFGYDAFAALGRPDLLFQMHPHPATMRRILLDEMHQRPESADSLRLEWELSLPEIDFQHLVAETGMASRFIVASSFTRDSLIEHGTHPDAISVVPYGVDLARFHPSPQRTANKTLRLLFVGRINQRKGLAYLLEALQLLKGQDVRLTICGRILDSLDAFAPYAAQVTILPSVDNATLVRAYQETDLFVLPSIAEGFGQVLLEALACGLPILSTTRTAAPDLIEDGVHGFIVEPQRADLLAERITWAIENREELAVMGVRARERAEHFTWEKFRRDTATAVSEFIRDCMAGEWEGAK